MSIDEHMNAGRAALASKAYDKAIECFTAALGLSRAPVTGYRAGCAHCQLRDKCEYRKRGETCER